MSRFMGWRSTIGPTSHHPHPDSENQLPHRALIGKQSSRDPGPHFDADDADDPAEKGLPDPHGFAIDLGIAGHGRTQQLLGIGN